MNGNPGWLCYVPSSLRKRIEASEGLPQILENIGWLLGDKVLRAGVGLLVLVWLARGLGPLQFGMLNFSIAFVALFGGFATLGLQGIVVRDLAQDPCRAPTTLGTSFGLQLVGGLLAFLAACGTAYVLRPGDRFTKWSVAILGCGLLFKASRVISYWFESQVRSKYPVWVENGTFLLISAVKIGLILADAPLIAFVWAIFAEVLIAATALMLVYVHRGGDLQVWRFSLTRARKLLKESWPLIISSLAIMVYMRIDQVMVGELMTDQAVGIYAAAVRISEGWYFVPMALVTSFFPAIVEAKLRSEPAYLARLQTLCDFAVLISWCIALPVAFLSDEIILLLFGEGYAEAASVLSIHVWAGLFVSLNAASGRWFLVENQQPLAMRRNLYGAFLNIPLNFLLIPVYGLVGAAYATVLAYSVAALFSDLLASKTRFLFFQKIRALFLINLIARLVRKPGDGKASEDQGSGV